MTSTHVRPDSHRLRFGGAVLLAGAVAISLPATVLMVGPIWGRPAAIALHWLLGGVAYVTWLAPTRRRAVLAGGFALLAGAVVIGGLGIGAARGNAGLAFAVAAVIAVTRSVILHRVGGLRGLAVEGVLGVAAVALAGLPTGSSLLAGAAAAWGFWLVQSVYPLLPGSRARRDDGASGDPFERATARLAALLEEA